ncbi:MAG: FAD-dependent oxidoreductase [Oscillochloris sp.]|nr:FAD-dependent oxidoreductase [Oscillochloris sp.]
MQWQREEHQSVWVATANMPTRPALSASIRTGVCVVGAGISGLTTAYLLARNGIEVTVLDDGPMGGGESRHTTAQITCVLDKGYAETEQLRGREGARQAASSHKAAIEMIAQIVQHEQIDCDFARVDGYLFTPPGGDRSDLEDELMAAQRAGLADTTMVERLPIEHAASGPALRFPNQAQFHILRYLEGLGQAVERLGGKIYCNTRVRRVRGGRPTYLDIEGGLNVIANATVLATHVPMNEVIGYSSKVFAYRTYVIGMKVPQGAIPHMIAFDTLDPYHYVRLQSVDDYDVLVVGGEDHRAGQHEGAADPYAALEQWTRRTFPQAGETLFAWAGQVHNSLDGLALIGPDLVDRGVFVITGQTGIGMTHSTLGGMIVSDIIQGRRNPWAALYDPTRFPTGSTGEVLREGLNVVKQYAGLLTGGDLISEQDIPLNSGAVIGWGITKSAIYRDPQGAVHRFSAVCPHAGCIVGWNDGEKTWDCPCHGSRFDSYGRQIHGPSPRDLDRSE